MEKIPEIEKNIKFITDFSNLNMDVDTLPSIDKVPKSSKFLTNEIGITYIGNILKDIDIKLYLTFLNMLNEHIRFNKDYDVKKSVCISEVVLGVTRDVKVDVPNIKNGVDLLATSHELGHALKSFSKINNERYLHYDNIFDETLSILFGKLCLDRYINDFGFDIDAQQFEVLNTRNAVNCLNKIKTTLPNYIKHLEMLEKADERINNSRFKNTGDDKYLNLQRRLEELEKELYKLISYPIGISLVNVYDNFDKNEKEEYLKFVSKYLLNLRHIDFEMILEYFDIPFDGNFYAKNFEEYIEKFKKHNKQLVLGGKK